MKFKGAPKRGKSGRRRARPDNADAKIKLASSHYGEISVGPIIALPQVLREHGVRPRRAFSAAGVDQRIFQSRDNRISLTAVGRLFEASVELTGSRHIGLMVGAQFALPDLGIVGYLMRNSASVGDALRSLLLHLHVHDHAAAPVLLTHSRSTVVLGYSVYNPDTPAIAQIYDAAVAIGYRMLSDLCGSSWAPQHVQFAYRRPSNTAPYKQFFRSTVRFDAEVSGIALTSSDLKRPINGADPVFYRVLSSLLSELEARNRMSFCDRVQRALHQMVLSGGASSGAMARLFDINERTLRRRMKDEGTSLQKLVQQTRCGLAQQMLENTELTVSEIAASLHYKDPNAFSRAFRSWAGLSPRSWRAQLNKLD